MTKNAKPASIVALRKVKGTEESPQAKEKEALIAFSEEEKPNAVANRDYSLLGSHPILSILHWISSYSKHTFARQTTKTSSSTFFNIDLDDEGAAA
jgi:hypothetical protein